MNDEQVRDLLSRRARKFAKNKGSTGVTAWAKHHGVAVSHMSDFLNGKRAPATDLLDALGLERSYSRKPKGVTDGG